MVVPSMIHGVTSDGANHNFGDYLWDPGSIFFNMGYILTNLEIGNGRKRGWFTLRHCMSWKRDSSWGGICQVHVSIV